MQIKSQVQKSTIRFSIAGIAAFLVYLCTMAPGIRFWDSAELTAAAYSGGIPHPPGFPLYMMLGRVLIAIGFAEPAFTMNLLSAICGAISVILLLHIFHGLNDGSESPGGYLSAAIFAFGGFLWMQSVRAEVYTFAVMLLLLSLYFFVKYGNNGQQKHLYAGLYFWSLTFAAHSAIATAAIIPLLLAGLANRNKAKVRFRDVPVCVMTIFIGYSTFLYLPIRGALNPAIKWGEPETVYGFFSMISAKEFAFSVKFDSMYLLSERLAGIWTALNENFPVGLALIAVIGIWSARRHAFLLLLFVLSIFIVVIREQLPYPDLRGYLLPVVFTAAVWTGFGADYIIKLLRKISILRAVKRMTFSPIAYIVVLGIALSMTTLNFRKYDLRGNNWAENYGRDILGSAADSSIIVLNDVSSHFICQYLQTVENVRPDAAILMLPALDISSKSRFWYHRSLQRNTDIAGLTYLPDKQTGIIARLIEANKDKREIFFEYGEHTRPFANYLVQDGLIYRLEMSGEDSSDAKYAFPGRKDFDNDIEAASIYSGKLYARSLYYKDKGNFEKSMDNYNDALRLVE